VHRAKKYATVEVKHTERKLQTGVWITDPAIQNLFRSCNFGESDHTILVTSGVEWRVRLQRSGDVNRYLHSLLPNIKHFPCLYQHCYSFCYCCCNRHINQNVLGHKAVKTKAPFLVFDRSLFLISAGSSATLRNYVISVSTSKTMPRQ
jgi:hypothetical protein